jgi:DNA-binding transcriptional LysR family regulator
MTVTRRPDLGALELLLSIAATGSQGETARAFGVSQPAVSMRVRQLERDLGLSLMERSTTGSRLTDAGRAVAQWAGKVIDSADALARGVEALRAEQSGQLRVAASMTIAEYLMPSWLVHLHTSAPAVVLALQVGNSEFVAERVRGHAADLGFVEGLGVPSDLRSRVIGHDELAVVAAPTHPWAARRRPVEVAEFADARMVLREPGSGTRKVFEHQLGRLGVQVRPAVELASTTAIKTAIAAGEGVGVVSRLAVASELADGRLAAITVNGLRLARRFRAVWAPGRPPAGPAGTFLALVLRVGA